MRDRCFRMVVTIATSATIACGDAADDPVTAPNLAAKPATPVAEQFPLESEVIASGIPTNAASLQIDANSGFENNNHDFSVTAHVSFWWSNEVTAMVDAWLLNKSGQTVNSGKKGLTYTRLGLPVAQGDTTLTVRISTNNTTCGLIGKGSYNGSAVFMALDTKLLQFKLSGQTIHTTTIEDVLQPACSPPAGCELTPVNRLTSSNPTLLVPSLSDCLPPDYPPVDGNEEFEVCFAVWRELWIYDVISQFSTLMATWFIGTICYFTTVMA